MIELKTVVCTILRMDGKVKLNRWQNAGRAPEVRRGREASGEIGSRVGERRFVEKVIDKQARSIGSYSYLVFCGIWFWESGIVMGAHR